MQPDRFFRRWKGMNSAMKWMRQFGIILTVSFLGEALRVLIPLPVPASIYGLLLMLLALRLGIVRLEQVRGAGRFLIEIMPVMFIPAAVGLLESWQALRPIWMQVIAVTLISTVLVMSVSGRVAQSVIRLRRKTEQKPGEESAKQ
jgi:holin-like protein